MLARLHDLNRRYDRLPEGRRFLTFITPFVLIWLLDVVLVGTYPVIFAACALIALPVRVGYLLGWYRGKTGT